MTLDVFLSVGSTKREDQISFVKAIEEHLDNIGLRPRALDRTDYFDSGLPLNDTTDLMRECSGAVVIAFERKYIREGVEKRYHPREEQAQLADVKICTVWNHIEAVQAHTLDQPVFVIAEQGLYSEGILENKHEWGVQWVPLDPEIVKNEPFKKRLLRWKEKVEQYNKAKHELLEEKAGGEREHVSPATPEPNPSEKTVGELISSLKPAQLYATVAALVTATSGIAALAYWLGTITSGGS